MLQVGLSTLLTPLGPTSKQRVVRRLCGHMHVPGQGTVLGPHCVLRSSVHLMDGGPFHSHFFFIFHGGLFVISSSLFKSNQEIEARPHRVVIVHRCRHGEFEVEVEIGARRIGLGLIRMFADTKESRAPRGGGGSARVSRGCPLKRIYLWRLPLLHQPSPPPPSVVHSPFRLDNVCFPPFPFKTSQRRSNMLRPEGKFLTCVDRSWFICWEVWSNMFTGSKPPRAPRPCG